MRLLCLSFSLLVGPLAIRAGDDAPSVARQALQAWRLGDAKVLNALAAPELKHRLRDSLLLRAFNDRRPGPVDLAKAPDEAIVTAFCAALRKEYPANPEVEYSDDYVFTQLWGSTHTEASHARVDFDCGARAVESHLVVRTPTEVMLEKRGDRWLLLWLPAAFDTIDAHWDARYEVESRSYCVPLYQPAEPKPMLPYPLRVADAVRRCEYLELRVSGKQFWSGYSRRWQYTMRRITDRPTIERLAGVILTGSEQRSVFSGSRALGWPCFRCYARQTKVLEGFSDDGSLICISEGVRAGPNLLFDKPAARQLHALVDEKSTRQYAADGAAN